MRLLRLSLIIIGLFFIANLAAQGPDDVPPEGSDGSELGSVPIAGGEMFFTVALVIGGVFIYRQQRKIKESIQIKP